VNAYGRLYSVLNRVETRDMTLSFVTAAHPRKLLDYLRREYRFETGEPRPGIYHVKEGIFAVQIIESKRLEGGGIGLGDLRGDRIDRIFLSESILKSLKKLMRGV
jgi:hypothetical protein